MYYVSFFFSLFLLKLVSQCKDGLNWVWGARWEGWALPHIRGILSSPEPCHNDILSCYAWTCTKDPSRIYKPNTKNHG